MAVTDPFSLAQIIGYGAMASSVYSLSFKSDRMMSKILIFTNSLWVLHYILLGALAGALIGVVNVLRSFAFLIHPERQRRWKTFTLFMVLYSISGFSSIKHTYDILPLIGSYATCAGLYLCNGIKTKLTFIISNTCFFIYSVFVFSIGGMISMATGIVIASVTIWRLHKEQSQTA